MARDDDGTANAVVHLHLHLPECGITVRHVIVADEALAALIHSLKKEISAMDAALQAKIDALAADVQAETTVNASAITLINGFAAQLAAALAAAAAAGATPEQLQALTDLSASVEGNSAALAIAVAAGTPAAVPAPAAAAPSGDLAGGASSDSATS